MRSVAPRRRDGVISRSAEHDKNAALLMAAPSPKGARKLLCGGRNFNINKKYREKYLLLALKKVCFYDILTLYLYGFLRGEAHFLCDRRKKERQARRFSPFSAKSIVQNI